MANFGCCIFVPLWIFAMSIFTVRSLTEVDRSSIIDLDGAAYCHKYQVLHAYPINERLYNLWFPNPSARIELKFRLTCEEAMLIAYCLLLTNQMSVCWFITWACPMSLHTWVSNTLSWHTYTLLWFIPTYANLKTSHHLLREYQNTKTFSRSNGELV